MKKKPWEWGSEREKYLLFTLKNMGVRSVTGENGEKMWGLESEKNSVPPTVAIENGDKKFKS